VNLRVPKWAWPLLIPFACSCAPWLFWFAAVEKPNSSDLEGALFIDTLIGIASLLATAPLLTAQLRLIPEPPLSFRAYALLYYGISAPTLIFQTLVVSCSVLVGFIPGSLLVSNETRTLVLAALLGVLLYAICAAFMNFVISKIGESLP
jgi:hypothetical protein